MKSLCDTLFVSLFVKFLFNFSKSLLYTHRELPYLFLRHCLWTRFPSDFLIQFFYPLSHLSHLILNHFLLRSHWHLVHDLLNVVEWWSVLKLKVQVRPRDFLLKHPLRVIVCHPRFDVRGNLGHGLLHVNKICLGAELLMDVRFICFWG